LLIVCQLDNSNSIDDMKAGFTVTQIDSTRFNIKIFVSPNSYGLWFYLSNNVVGKHRSLVLTILELLALIASLVLCISSDSVESSAP
jgi:hypothetical protein